MFKWRKPGFLKVRLCAPKKERNKLEIKTDPMAVREIVQYPAEILRKPARKVTRTDLARLNKVIEDMRDTLESAHGAGLAAPQVNEDLRVCLALKIETEEVRVYINPVIKRAEGEEIGEEGCLSFNGLVGLVPRATRIWVKFQDESLRWHSVVLEGLSARILQHEIDHLNGVTIKDTSIVELYKPKVAEEEKLSRAPGTKD